MEGVVENQNKKKEKKKKVDKIYPKQYKVMGDMEDTVSTNFLLFILPLLYLF